MEPTRETSPLAFAAAEAFLAGWASAGGPLTERFTPASHAAIAAALTRHDDPAVLETTLLLGKLEGSWATVYDRRLKMIHRHVRKTARAWRKAIAALDTRALVTGFRRQALLPTEAVDPTGDTGTNHEQLRLAAAAAALTWLRGILDGPHFTALAATIETALRRSQAEGETGATLLAADKAGHTGLNVDLKFRDALKALKDLPSLHVSAHRWVQRIIEGASTDLGNALAKAAEHGATYDDMLRVVTDTVGRGQVRAVTTLLDYAMSAAMNKGALDLYRREGIQEVGWITAGDRRVCNACAMNEANGPYQAGNFPDCPAHPLCRCCPYAIPDFTPHGLSRYLPNPQPGGAT